MPYNAFYHQISQWIFCLHHGMDHQQTRIHDTLENFMYFNIDWCRRWIWENKRKIRKENYLERNLFCFTSQCLFCFFSIRFICEGALKWRYGLWWCLHDISSKDFSFHCRNQQRSANLIFHSSLASHQTPSPLTHETRQPMLYAPMPISTRTIFEKWQGEEFD